MTDKLQVVHPDIPSLTHDEYALLRRQGLGASDSSTILGVNVYNTLEDLVSEKCATKITDEERKIGQKDVVRKGFDLEDLNLEKFGKLMGTPKPYKPTAMYSFKDYPYLTINFDGVLEEVGGATVPVEAKFVSTYGDKYYDRVLALKRETGTCELGKVLRPYQTSSIIDNIKAHAEQCGVPPYYYTQIQQQMFGLDAPYGYLTALHDKGWELCVYKIPRNQEVINAIITEGTKAWLKIERRRKLLGR